MCTNADTRQKLCRRYKHCTQHIVHTHTNTIIEHTFPVRNKFAFARMRTHLNETNMRRHAVTARCTTLNARARARACSLVSRAKPIYMFWPTRLTLPLYYNSIATFGDVVVFLAKPPSPSSLHLLTSHMTSFVKSSRSHTNNRNIRLTHNVRKMFLPAHMYTSIELYRRPRRLGRRCCLSFFGRVPVSFISLLSHRYLSRSLRWANTISSSTYLRSASFAWLPAIWLSVPCCAAGFPPPSPPTTQYCFVRLFLPEFAQLFVCDR